MNNKISASLMCADLLNLESQIKELEFSGVDFLHLDVMDSSFVPNITFGIDTINQIKKVTKLPLDIHLLIQKPSTVIRSINLSDGDFVTIHAECSERIIENVAYIKQKGGKFGLALNPDTNIEEIEKYLPYVDMVNIMLIVPGFAGSSIIHGILEKVKDMRIFLDSKNYHDVIIEVDGSVSYERASILKSYGATMFVCGTASIFKKNEPFSETVKKFNAYIN